MTKRKPLPHEIWPDDEERQKHMQAEFDAYDALVAREKAEIAARQADFPIPDGVTSTDFSQASNLQVRNSNANGVDLLGSPTALNAARQADLPIPDGVPSTDFSQASNLQVRNSNANGADLLASSTALNAVRNDPLISLLESPSTSNDTSQQPVVEFTITDALAPPPPLEWCVEGLFARPSVSVLVGDPGSKKTFTVIDLAVCVATGKPWLDHPVTQGSVLFY